MFSEALSVIETRLAVSIDPAVLRFRAPSAIDTGPVSVLTPDKVNVLDPTFVSPRTSPVALLMIPENSVLEFSAMIKVLFPITMEPSPDTFRIVVSWVPN